MGAPLVSLPPGALARLVGAARLRNAGIVATSSGGGYQLTGDGHSLLDTLAPLDAWAKRWATRTAPRSPS